VSGGFNSGLGMSRSYYAATANRFEPAPVLEGDRETDVVIVGAGFTGLHAALSLAERGCRVLVLEAGRIGWGASGRNGGQLIPGWRKGARELVRHFGEERARLVFELSLKARDLVLARAQMHCIDCDLVLNGHLLAAAAPRELAWMNAEVEALERVMNYRHARVLSAEATHAKLNSPMFHGGLYDALGGHFHPLNYALGLAKALRARDQDALFEHSRVVSLEPGDGVLVRTAAGRVRAKYAVLACDALLDGLAPRLAAHIMPVANYLAATAPIENGEALIGDNLAVSDTRFVVNYFRLSAERRLIFGGGERYTPNPPADIAAFVRPFMVKVFPQLADVAIDYAWGGLVSITRSRLPHIGRMGEVFFAHGYSGQGLTLPAIAAEAIGAAVGGDSSLLEALVGLAPPPFPGGAALRAPLHVLGMLWYALRDRL
jgi:gamma-glutamylputrescine oxidase